MGGGKTQNEKNKQRWDLLDQNSVCLSVWGRGDGLFCGVRWQVSLTWLLPWHEGLIPCKGLTSEKFKGASVSTPSSLKPSECYKIITTTNQFTNKRQTNHRHWQANVSRPLSLHGKIIKGVSTILRRIQTNQADFAIAFDLLRQRQKRACIPRHTAPQAVFHGDKTRDWYKQWHLEYASSCPPAHWHLSMATVVLRESFLGN